MSEGTAIAQVVANVLAKLDKVGKLVFKPTDNKAVLAHLDNAPGFSPVDWTEKAPESWTGVMLVNTKGRKGEVHKSETRVIKFPDMDTLFADLGMKSMLFDAYLGKLAAKLANPEAEEASFASVGGPWAEEGNKSYTFQAEGWIALLLEKTTSEEQRDALKKILNTRSLKLALESAEYASSKFSGMPQQRWVTLLNLMKTNAQRNGYSTAMFDHYLATRDMVANAKAVGDIDLGDNAEAVLSSLQPAKAA